MGQSLGYHGNIPSGNVAGKSPKCRFFFLNGKSSMKGWFAITMHVWSPEGMYISYWFILVIPLCILDHPYTKICNWYLTALSAHDVIVIGCGWSQNNVLPMSFQMVKGVWPIHPQMTKSPKNWLLRKVWHDYLIHKTKLIAYFLGHFTESTSFLKPTRWKTRSKIMLASSTGNHKDSQICHTAIEMGVLQPFQNP